jgi:hypothetical protein
MSIHVHREGRAIKIPRQDRRLPIDRLLLGEGFPFICLIFGGQGREHTIQIDNLIGLDLLRVHSHWIGWPAVLGLLCCWNQCPSVSVDEEVQVCYLPNRWTIWFIYFNNKFITPHNVVGFQNILYLWKLTCWFECKEKIIKLKMTTLLHSLGDNMVLTVKKCLKIYTVRNITFSIDEQSGLTMPISYSFKQGTLPITSLISKQAVPYRTHGGTYCPGVSTHKTRSLVDSSITIHITQRNPTVSTIPTYAQTTASFLTTVTSHHDGWKTNTEHKPNSTS